MEVQDNEIEKRALAKVQYDKEQQLKNEMRSLVQGPALDALDKKQQKQLNDRDYDAFYLNSLKVDDEIHEEQQKIFGDVKDEMSQKMRYRIEEQKKLMAKIEVPSKIVAENKSKDAKGANTGVTENLA